MTPRFAATARGFDDIGAVLSNMGEGFDFHPMDVASITYEQLKRYEVLFVNCASESSHVSDRVAFDVRRYVEQGGSLYASDYAGGLLSQAFPEFVEFDQSGKTGTVACTVPDEGLQAEIGKHLDIHFDLPSWWKIQKINGSVRVYVEARGKGKSGKGLPVVIGFPCKRGHVIYTSFHNSAQVSQAEQKLLRFLALRPILAQAVTEVSTLFAKDKQVTPGREIISALNKNGSSDPYVYQSAGDENIICVLHWSGSGARLRLTVQDPKGAIVQQVDGNKPPVQVEIPQASAGQWKCVVEPVQLPHDNFPFVLTLATRKGGAKTLPPPIKAPPKAVVQLPVQASKVPDVLWSFYLLIDCSAPAAQFGGSIAQGVSAIVSTLRANPLPGIVPAVAFGECRQTNANISEPLPLTQKSNLNLACSGDPVLIPTLSKLIELLQRPRLATALGKPLVVVVLVGEPRDEFEVQAQNLQAMAAGGQLNLIAVGMGNGISDQTLRKVARVALRVKDVNGSGMTGCFNWLGQVGLVTMKSLKAGGAGQTISLPPLPAGVETV